MNAVTMSKRERLRARDGDACWLCAGILDFDSSSAGKNLPTLEHLDAKMNGGSGRLDNLVLCHFGCNRQLGTRPKEEKIKIRAKRIDKVRAQLAEWSRQDSTLDRTAVVTNAKTERATSAAHAISNGAEVPWPIVAAIATGAAIFFAGLSAGLLIGS